MVEYLSDRLDATFAALADPTRRGMLATLATGDQTISDLAAPYAMSLAAASKHVKKLEAAGLVTREIRGRSHICRLDAAALREAHAWTERYQKFWAGRLDALEAALATDIHKPERTEND
ncbi:ArsR/SmtB family transcription factor [Kordiimonas lacus]|uniref:DNA-binding transcriptional regulator, ArsR family n=1 Tax=Kordiimonas lacus TaxID=637679 RepID=A0A1G6XXH1_9PROT|nr:metalloregulator ArsR/SmtB family transcription factor [Kordiimonas lacus]SDD82888.1 DNA-binding transcriptional regulator, ArsR family [Kordiimonas lacus]